MKYYAIIEYTYKNRGFLISGQSTVLTHKIISKSLKGLKKEIDSFTEEIIDIIVLKGEELEIEKIPIYEPVPEHRVQVGTKFEVKE